jgi:predicted nucleic acid-binding protein
VKSVFLDTSGWFAALSPREARHDASMAAYRGWIEGGTRMVTSNLVVAEMQILVSRFRGTGEGVAFLDALHQDATHEVVFVDRELERAAVDRWLRRYGDRSLSLAGAVSFEIMRTRQMRRVLALDAHFEAAGFELVPAR